MFKKAIKRTRSYSALALKELAFRLSSQRPATLCRVCWPSVSRGLLPEHNLRGGSLVTLRVATATIGQNSFDIHSLSTQWGVC